MSVMKKLSLLYILIMSGLGLGAAALGFAYSQNSSSKSLISSTLIMVPYAETVGMD